jgi:dihydroorotase
VREARDRGVRLVVGHGMHNFSFDVARRLLDQDFLPDMVSTDGHRLNLHGPVYDQPTTMAKLMALGVPLGDVVAMATSHAAELLGRSDELGSLAVGRVADVTLLRLEERPWIAVDSRRQELPAHQQLVPVLALRAGEVIEPRPSDAP